MLGKFGVIAAAALLAVSANATSVKVDGLSIKSNAAGCEVGGGPSGWPGEWKLKAWRSNGTANLSYMLNDPNGAMKLHGYDKSTFSLVVDGTNFGPATFSYGNFRTGFLKDPVFEGKLSVAALDAIENGGILTLVPQGQPRGFAVVMDVKLVAAMRKCLTLPPPPPQLQRP